MESLPALAERLLSGRDRQPPKRNCHIPILIPQLIVVTGLVAHRFSNERDGRSSVHSHFTRRSCPIEGQAREALRERARSTTIGIANPVPRAPIVNKARKRFCRAAMSSSLAVSGLCDVTANNPRIALAVNPPGIKGMQPTT